MIPAGLERDDIILESSSRSTFWWSMIFSDLPAPAEASSQNERPCQGFAQAGNRFPLFGIML
jgi:hypothetical protein